MNRLKIAEPDGRHSILRITQRRQWYAEPGRPWLRSPADTKAYAARQGYTLTGTRQRRAS